MADPVKKLSAPRMNERLPVTILADNGKAEGETRQITVQGMFIHCLERLRPGKRYSMIVKVPQNPITLTGQLVWCNLDNIESGDIIPGMGLSFLKIANGDRERLADAIVASKDTRDK